MPVLFPNEEIDIYACQNESFDYYGSQNEYVYKETISVDMQLISPTSSLKEFGKILQDTYRVIMDENVEINDTDQLRINDTKYEIIGSIENCNHGVWPHKEMVIKRQRKEVQN